MDDEKLIKLVKSHDVLFNIKHEKYMDSKFKKKIWIEIGKQMNQTGSICKSRWNNMRDQYRKYLQKIATRSGKALYNTKKYKYSEQLKYLKPFFHPKTLNNLSSEEHLHYSENEEILEDSSQEQGNNQNTDNLEKIQLPGDCKVRQKLIIDNNLENIKRPQKCRMPKGRRSKLQTSISLTLIKLILENIQKETPQQIDSVDTFLAGIAPTLKTFTPYYLNLAKTKIFQIVQDYEMKIIVDSKRTKIDKVRNLPSTSTSAFCNSPTLSFDCISTPDQGQQSTSYSNIPISSLAEQQEFKYLPSTNDELL